MNSLEWFAAHLTDYRNAAQSPNVSPAYLAQQLADLRNLAAVLIAGEY